MAVSWRTHATIQRKTTTPNSSSAVLLRQSQARESTIWPISTVFLMTICDAGVSRADGVKPQKVAIVAYGDAVRDCSVFKVLLVRRSDEARTGGRRDINSPLAKSMGNSVGDALVKMKANLHRRRCLRSGAGRARLPRRRRIARLHG